MWAEIVADCLVGPNVSSHLPTGNHYRDFLLQDLPELLGAVPLQSEHECGTCVMVLRAVRDVLNNAYHDRWIGRGGPTAWPPLSTPDLNPSDFYLWGHLNTFVYATPVDNEEAHHIVDACQTVRNYPGIFARIRRSMMRLP
jgi:hypothetical protein